MTVAPPSQPLTCVTVEDAVAALRARGLRVSMARRLVLETLFTAEQPLPAERIAETLQLDLASVYRNLETFEQHGLVRHFHLGHSPGLYALVTQSGQREYLYCERCQTVTAVESDQLDPLRDSVRQQFGYDVHFTHFAMIGICQDCSAAPA